MYRIFVVFLCSAIAGMTALIAWVTTHDPDSDTHHQVWMLVVFAAIVGGAVGCFIPPGKWIGPRTTVYVWVSAAAILSSMVTMWLTIWSLPKFDADRARMAYLRYGIIASVVIASTVARMLVRILECGHAARARQPTERGGVIGDKLPKNGSEVSEGFAGNPAADDCASRAER